MSSRRFAFTTGSHPTIGGEGTLFDSGVAAYRTHTELGVWSPVYSGTIADLTARFGSALTLTYLDSAPAPPTLTSVSAVVDGTNPMKGDLSFTCSAAISGTITWGDGSAPTSFTATAGTLNQTANHVYATKGKRAITIAAVNASGNAVATAYISI